MKRVISILIIIMMLFSLIGCNVIKPPDDEPAVNLENNADTEENNEYVTPKPEKVTVIDSEGREVTTSSTNGDIISVGFEATSLLIALGAKGRLTGVEDSASENKLFLKAFPQITDIAKITSGDTVLTDDIIAQKPGLVVLTKKNSSLVPVFDDAGITCAVVALNTIEDIKNSITLMGTLSNTNEKAQKLSAYYDSALTRIKALTMTEERKSISIYNNDEFLTQLLSNLSCDITENGEITVSQLDNAPSGALTVPNCIERWDKPSVSLVLGLYWFTFNIYPNVISKNEMAQKAINFYSEFYSVTLTADDVGVDISDENLQEDRM